MDGIALIISGLSGTLIVGFRLRSSPGHVSPQCYSFLEELPLNPIGSFGHCLFGSLMRRQVCRLWMRCGHFPKCSFKYPIGFMHGHVAHRSAALKLVQGESYY